MRNACRAYVALLLLASAGCSSGAAGGSGGSGSGGMPATGSGGSSSGTGGSGSGGSGTGGASSGGSGGTATGGSGSGGASSGSGGAGTGSGGTGGPATGSGGAAPTGGRGGAPAGSGGAGGGPAGSGGAAGAAASAREIVYVGSNSNDISVYTLNTTTGALTGGTKTQAGTNPSFLAVERSGKFLYAVNEGSMQLAAFSIDQATGGLTFLNRVSSGGDGPAHIGVDRGGKFVMAANYNAGITSILRIEPDGKLGASTDTKSPGTNSHMIVTDLMNKFAFVPCKGSNYIAQYRFDPAAGTMTANTPARVMTKAGAGPRHLALHPSGSYAYVINELDSTMNAYALASDGTLTELQSLSTLPTGATGQNTGAEVVVSADGAFVYGSNRGHDSIVIYAVAAATGRLTLVDHQSTGGTTPRSFGIDPSGAFLLVANQGSNNVVTFKIDRATGKLSGMMTTAVAQGPQFVGAYVIPAP